MSASPIVRVARDWLRLTATAVALCGSIATSKSPLPTYENLIEDPREWADAFRAAANFTSLTDADLTQSP